jgi:hypothetical protein
VFLRALSFSEQFLSLAVYESVLAEVFPPAGQQAAKLHPLDAVTAADTAFIFLSLCELIQQVSMLAAVCYSCYSYSYYGSFFCAFLLAHS